MINPEQLVQELATKMQAANLDWKGKSTPWTYQLKEFLREILEARGTPVSDILYTHANTHNHEFLLDIVVWSRSEVARDAITLAAECEWGQCTEDIVEDFLKLLVVKSPLKLLIFGLNAKARIHTHKQVWKSLSECLLKYRDHCEGERYVFIDYAEVPAGRAWWIEIPVNGPLQAIPEKHDIAFAGYSSAPAVGMRTELSIPLSREEYGEPATDTREAEEVQVFGRSYWLSKRQERRSVQERFLGCLLGGAVGDALGAPVEFMSRADILRRFGPKGVTQYAPAYGAMATITDDTQMTMFTAEGLIRAWVRGCFKGITTYSGVTAHAYLRWLQTQGECPSCDIAFDADEPGWLFQHRQLHSRRAPGNTCMSALRAMRSLGEPARNDSKGCGGVMRVAPVGLFAWSLRQDESPQHAFQLGTELAGLTHGHPTGALTGGVLAVLILALTDGASLPEAIAASKAILRTEADHEETLRAIETAEELAHSGLPPEEAIGQLGKGWVAEEALAISIYCALVARDFKHGVILAVNHDGDSDSTGSIVGNLLGTLHGVNAIPAEWTEPLELRDVITELAGDLFAFKDWEIGEYSENEELNQRIWRKYPGF